MLALRNPARSDSNSLADLIAQMLLYALLALAGAALLSLLGVVVAAAWVAHKMTVQERVQVSGHPLEFGLHWVDATFYSRYDHILLRGWYLQSTAADRAVIMIQGTEHHRNSPGIQALRLGRDLVRNGFNVLLFDLRARGESGGQRSTAGDREQWDVLGAIDYVQAQGISVERIGLLGFSLGAGIAILVAAQESRIPAVVSDSGFVDNRVDLAHLKIGPIKLPLWTSGLVVLAGRLLFRSDFERVRPALVIEQVEQPIFFIHGADDPVISVDETITLHTMSDNPDDRIWIVPGAEHVNTYPTMPATYAYRVGRFFRRHIP